MNINNVFPSKWLKSGDVPEDGDLTLAIKTVTVETVGQGEDAEDKPILYFTENDKGLVLNKTNANTISNLYGPETDGWTGKRISLFATEVQFGKQMTLALRVRTKPPKSSNGHVHAPAGAFDILTREQAVTAVVAAGLSKEDLARILPVNEAGLRTYKPERDTEKVYELIRQNTPPAAEELPF